MWINTVYYATESAGGQDEGNPAFWLATQVGKMGSSCSLGISRVGTARKSSLFSHIINLLLTKLVRLRLGQLQRKIELAQYPAI